MQTDVRLHWSKIKNVNLVNNGDSSREARFTTELGMLDYIRPMPCSNRPKRGPRDDVLIACVQVLRYVVSVESFSFNQILMYYNINLIKYFNN